MTTIKILGTGCAKCKTTYNNALEAVKQANIQAEVIKIEDITEIMTYDVLTTPALLLNEEIKIKGRVAETKEIIDLLKGISPEKENSSDCCCSDSGCC